MLQLHMYTQSYNYWDSAYKWNTPFGSDLWLSYQGLAILPSVTTIF